MQRAESSKNSKRHAPASHEKATHLSEIELGVLLSSNTLDLEERGVRACVALATLVTENAALAVESVNLRICQNEHVGRVVERTGRAAKVSQTSVIESWDSASTLILASTRPHFTPRQSIPSPRSTL